HEWEISQWPIYERLLSQAYACFALSQESELGFPESITLFERLGVYLRERGRYAEAEEVLSHAFRLKEQSKDGDPLAVAVLAHQLGSVYVNLADATKARTYLQQAVRLRTDLLGKHHPDTLESRFELAYVSQDTDQFMESQHTLQEVSESYLELLQTGQIKGSENRSLNLAFAAVWYYYQVGNYQEAEAFMEQVVLLAQQIYGNAHPRTAVQKNFMARLYREHGQSEKAHPLAIEALAILEQTYGHQHLETQAAMNNLSWIWNELGLFQEAEVLGLQVLALWETMVPPSPFPLIYNFNNLASLFSKQGDHEKAEAFCQRALHLPQLAEMVDRGKQEALSEILQTLATVRQRQGNYQEAEDLYQQTLILRERISGPAHWLTTVTLESSIKLLRELGRGMEAVPLEQELQERRALQGPSWVRGEQDGNSFTASQLSSR
ncbi:MAG TPA: tetratricopeptide repeat protein, partial [Ktedonobacteraceae bacterium]|nr:tetratricopeptide repeat protein [Ktedonobacteraceae bacterium]